MELVFPAVSGILGLKNTNRIKATTSQPALIVHAVSTQKLKRAKPLAIRQWIKAELALTWAKEPTFGGYLFAGLAVAAGLLLRRALTMHVGDDLPTYVTFYPAVVAAALLGGRGPGLLATALTLLVVDWWVVSPREWFFLGRPAETAGAILFALMCVFLTMLTERYRRAREEIAVFEKQMALQESQAALREAEEKRRLALEAGELGDWNYNLETGEVFWDECCRKIFGVTDGDSIDYHQALSIILKEDRVRVERAVRKALLPGSAGTYEQEYRVLRPDGTIRWVNAAGQVCFQGDGEERKPQRLVGVIRDITNSKRAQAALLESEAQFRAIFEFASVGIVQADIATGRFLRFNDKYCEITGYSAEELRGLTFPELTHPDDRAGDWERFSAALRNQAPLYSNEKRYLRKDGRVIWVKVNAAFIRDASGTSVRTVAICEDITERKAADQMLRESEEQLRLVLERSNDAIFWADAETGIILRCNQKAEELTERSRDEVVGMHQSQLHPPDQDYAEVFRRATSVPQAENIEAELLSRSGKRIPVMINSSVVAIGDRHVIQGVFRDVSARKQAEDKLRQSEEDLNHAQSVAHVGSWRLDLRRNQLSWSEENWRIFGLPKGTLLTYQAFLDTVHPDDRDYVDRHWKATLRGEAYDIEHRIVVGGNVKWVRERAVLEFDSRGEVLGGFGTAQDITERKEAQAALANAYAGLELKVRERTIRLREIVKRLRQEIRVRREAERCIQEAEFRYRTVADFTYDWEYWRTPDGNLSYCSPSCCRVTGYTAQELVADGQLLQRIILPEDLPIWDAHEKATFTDPDFREIQFRIRNKRGEIRWIEHSCRTVTGSRGEFLGIRASNRDVTERIKQEMDARALREELNRLSRITVAGQLAAAIAHELNQPLGAVLCNAQAADQWLGREPIDLAEARAALEDIQEDCRRAGTVIQRLRSLYQRGQREPEPLHFNGIIRDTLELVHSEFVFKGVSVHLELDPTLSQVKGNPVELQQVILNLVMNAVEAMMSVDSAKRRLEIHTRREPDGQVHAALSDSGPGLTSEQLERMFEPFYTTKDTGMGMGLAISLSIIEEHRGQLWAVNNSEGGATFHLTLPEFLEGTK